MDQLGINFVEQFIEQLLDLRILEGLAKLAQRLEIVYQPVDFHAVPGFLLQRSVR